MIESSNNESQDLIIRRAEFVHGMQQPGVREFKEKEGESNAKRGDEGLLGEGVEIGKLVWLLNNGHSRKNSYIDPLNS